MRFDTVQRWQCVTENGAADFEAHLDEVMGELAVLEAATDGVDDVDIGANLETHEVRVTMWVEADDQVEAVRRAMTTLRVALHTVGASTPGWDQSTAAVEVRPSEPVGT